MKIKVEAKKTCPESYKGIQIGRAKQSEETFGTNLKLVGWLIPLPSSSGCQEREGGFSYVKFGAQKQICEELLLYFGESMKEDFRLSFPTAGDAFGHS